MAGAQDSEGSPFLRVGDWVSLFCDHDSYQGFIVSEGFADENAQFRLIRPKESSIRNFQDAVFEVHILKNYVAHREYRRMLELRGLEDGSFSSRLSGLEEITTLRKKNDAEARANDELQKFSRGQYVCYGHMVELKHVKSGKYLRIEPAVASEGNAGALAVQVGEQDERCVFKILPRFKLHTEGERVHVNDQVVLHDVKTNHSVHLQSSIHIDHEHREVNATVKRADTGFQVCQFAPYVPASMADGLLKGGSIVRFYNKENDGYVVVEGLDEDAAQPEPHLHATRTARESTNALFMIEHEVSSNGSFLAWRNVVRVRHVASDLYLTVYAKDQQQGARHSRAVSALELQMVEEDDGSDPDKLESIRDKRVGLTDNINDDGTQFHLDAFYKEEAEGRVTVSKTFRLRSVPFGAFVHFVDPATRKRRHDVEGVEGGEGEGEGESESSSDEEEEEDGALVQEVKVEAKRLPMRLSLKAYDEDTLVFVRVESEQVSNLNEVKGMMPTLLAYTEQFEKGNAPDSGLRGITYRVQRILRALLLFVQEVPSHKRREDPLRLDYPPIKLRQKVMTEHGLLDVVLRLLDAPFGFRDKRKGMMTLEDMVSQVENKAYLYVAQLGYRLVKQAIKGNPMCRMHLSSPKNVELMQSHLDAFQLRAAGTLMELFRDNRHLLDRLSDKHLTVFLGLIRRIGKLSRYMAFLSSLATCQGEGMTANQRRICQLFFVDNASDCVVATKFEKHEVFVDLESVKVAEKRGAPDWKRLSLFVKECPKEQLTYFERMLVCLSDLCVGRNAMCISVVSRLLPFDMCFKGATDPTIESENLGVCAAFMRLIQHVYVDTDPHDAVASIRSTRPWKAFDVDIPKSEHLASRVRDAPVIRHRKTDSASVVSAGNPRSPRMLSPRMLSPRLFGKTEQAAELVEKRPSVIRTASSTGLIEASQLESEMFSGVNFSPLKVFLLEWVEKCRRQVAEEVGRNRFTHACLDLLRELLRFGFFGEVGEMMSLVDPLIECLDGRDDVQRAEQEEDKEGLRYEDTPENKVILDCKETIVRTLQVIADLRGDLRLSRLLKMFEERFERDDFVPSRGATPRNAAQDANARRDTVAAFVKSAWAGGEDKFEAVFNTMILRTIQGRELTPILLDCTRYDYHTLGATAFAFLVRTYSQRLVMLRAIQNTQLLGDESSKVFRECMHSLRTISTLIQANMQQEDEVAVLEALTQLEHCAIDTITNKPVPVNQRILRSVGAHDMAHRLLRLPFSGTMPQEKTRREIFLGCYRLLKNFARMNSTNQAILLPKVPFYMSQMYLKLGGADTLTEVFRNNRQVCNDVQESTIRHIVSIMNKGAMFPRYIVFFQILVKPDLRPIPRNQELVLKALAEKAPSCILLFKDPDERDERRRLIADEEHNRPDSRLVYHVKLVELFAMMVEGQNRATLAKSKVWLSVEHARSHIEEDGLPLFVRAPFIDFFTNCHVQVSRPPDAATLEELWGTMKAVTRVMGQCMQAAKTEQEDPRPCLKSICGLVASFFSNTVLTAHDWRYDEAEEIANTFAKCLKEVPFGDDMELTQRAMEAVQSLAFTDASAVTEGLFPQLEVDEEVLVKRQSTALHAVVHDEEASRIAASLSMFATEFADRLGMTGTDGFSGPEFESLLEIFMDPEPQATERKPFTAMDMEEAKWTGGNRSCMTLIQQVQLLDQRRTKRTCLRILARLAQFKDPEADPPVTMTMSQNRLDKLGEFSGKGLGQKTCGATRMALRMMVDPAHHGELREVLDVAIALLNNGNKNVQQRVYKFFRSEWGVGFFESIQQLVREGMVEVKELQAHHKRVRKAKASMAGASEQEILRSLPVFSERTHMQRVLRFIQLTAEGHNDLVQNYWRTQNARRTYDIVTDIADYANTVFNAGIDSDNVGYAVQCLRTLTELMQGPCVANQQILAGSKLPATCSKILQADFPYCRKVDVSNLKEETALCMSAMLEGCTDVKVPQGLSNEFNLEYLVDMLLTAYDAARSASGPFDEEVEEQLETAFQIYCFLLTLRDFVPSIGSVCYEKLGEEAGSWYSERTGKIEINQNGRLARMYFRLPELASRLTESSKHKLLWTVNRSSATKKLDDYLSKAEELEAEMVHQQGLSRGRVVSWFTSDGLTKFFNGISLVLATVINLMMIASYKDPEESGVTKIADKLEFTVIYTTAFVLAFLDILRFIQFVMIRASLIIRKGYKQHARLVDTLGIASKHKDNDSVLVALGKRVVRVVMAASFLIIDPKFTVELGLFGCSVIGFTVSPLAFCVHVTFFLIENSVDLQNVLKSITLNGRSLLITTVFGVILVYVMAIWAFVSFRDHYIDEDGKTSLCQDLFQCTVVSFNGGLRKGDIGEVLQDTEWGDGAFIVFQFFYFAAIITIMLNIIFGIIIDTFSELRQIRAQTEDDITNKCFICSIDRYTFDRLTEGFEHHIKSEHNMWEYLFFMVHLNLKDPNDYSGPESFVRKCMDAKDAQWFPVNQAMTLAEHLRKEQEAQTFLTNSVQSTMAQTVELVAVTTRMQEQLDELEEMVKQGLDTVVARLEGLAQGSA